MRSTFLNVVRPLARTAVRRHRLTPLAQALALSALLATPPWLQAQTGARGLQSGLPSGLQVVQGQASVATQGTQMTVKNSAGAILNWQSFSIGAAHGVHFQQAGAASKVLNRVVGNDPSAIFGSLTSNGQVWLLNPNGVLFGAGARVDVAGLVASTLRLNDNDFLAGRYRFSAADGDRAGIRNDGALTSSFGGQVVLLGDSVTNAGSVEAPGGGVALLAARSVELVDTGLPNLVVRVDVPAGEVLNLGRLAAAGGTVDVWGGIVNQQGLVAADTLGVDAQGRVTLRAADTLMLGAASRTTAVGVADGAKGGQVDLLAAQVGAVGRAEVDASGAAGGGGIRLGGGLQGKDSDVPNARAVVVGGDVVLRADAATQGDGGRVIVWADEGTRFAGRVSARGAGTGAGGFAEVSGKGALEYTGRADLRAPSGAPGTLLLDPQNIVIQAANPNLDGTPGSDLAGPIINFNDFSDSVITAGAVNAQLASANVTLQAQIDITVNAPILRQGANSLTLQAGRDITINSPVEVWGGINLYANDPTPAAFALGKVVVNADLNAQAGVLAIRNDWGGGAPGTNLLATTQLTAGQLLVQGPVQLNNTVEFRTLGALSTIDGDISGSGGLTKTGPFDLLIVNQTFSTYSGATDVQQGTLLVAGGGGSQVLGTGTVLVASGATLDLSGGATVPNDIVLSGGRVNSSLGNGQLTGNILLASDSLFSASPAGPALLITGTGNLGGSAQAIIDAGDVRFESSSNSHSGGTVVTGGASLSINDVGALGSGVLRLNNGTLVTSFSDAIDNPVVVDSGGGTLLSLGSSYDFTGGISGAGSLFLFGSGSFTLSAAATHGGGTFVGDGLNALTVTVAGGVLPAGGTLEVASNAALFMSGSQSIATLTGLGTVDLGAAVDSLSVTDGIFGGVLLGAGSLVKAGAGTLTLSGANTHSGGTTISGGTVRLSGASASLGTGTTAIGSHTLLVDDGAQVSGALSAANGATIGNTSGDGTVSAGVLALADGTALNLSASGNGLSFLRVIPDVVGGAGAESVVVTTPGSSVLLQSASTYTGGTTVSANSSFSLGGGATTAAGTGPISVAAGSVLNVGDGVTIANAVGLGNGSSLNAYNGPNGDGAVSGNLTVTGTAELRTSTGNLPISGVIGGAGNVLVQAFGGPVSLGAVNTYAGTTQVSRGTLATAGTNALPDGTAVTVDSGTTLALGGSETIASLAGAGNVNLGTFTLTTGGGNASTTFSGGLVGTGALVKTGTGTFTLNTGNSSFGGGTTVSAGTLALDGASAAVGTGAIGVASGATLEVDNGAAVANAVTLSGGTIANVAGNGFVNGNVAMSAPSTLASVSLLQVNGVISGTAGLTKAGAGTVQFGGNNTYNGTTTISAGTLAVGTGGTSGTLGAGNVVDNGTLAFNRSNALTVSNTISGTGVVRQEGSGTTTLFATNSYSGATLINAGTLATGTGNVLPDASTVNLAGGTLQLGSDDTVAALFMNVGTATLAGTFTLTAANYTLGGNATVSANLGAGTLDVTGGTVLLGGTAAAGFVNLNGGTLTLGSADRLADTATLTVNAGATLDMGFNAETIAKLVLDGGTLTNGGTLIGITDHDLRSGIVNVDLGGSVAMFKTTAGTVQLTQANSYTIGTSVSDGTLVTTVAGALPASGIVFVSGGTLDLGGNTQSVQGLDLSGGTVTGGTLNLGQTSSLTGGQLAAGTTLGGTGGVVVNGNVGVSGQLAYTGTTVLQAGTLTIDSNQTLSSLLLLGGTLTGTGDVTVAGTLAFQTASVALQGTGTLTTQGTTTVDMSLASQSVDVARPWINQGFLVLSGDDQIVLSAAGPFTNAAAGLINLTGGASTPLAGAAGAVFTNAGTLNQAVATPHALSANLSFVNTGTIDVSSGSLTLPPATTQSGVIDISAGATLIAGGNLTNAGGGVIQGLGTLDMASFTLTNLGTISPGGSGFASTLAVTGNVDLATGTLDLDLGGTGAGQSDLLAVTGNVTLGGTANTTLISGYTPLNADFIPIVTATGTRSGSFGTLNALTGFAAGYSLAAGEAARLIYTQDPLTKIFTNAIGNLDWGTAGNWAGGQPGAPDTALISAGYAVTHASGNDTITALSISSGNSLDVSGGSLTVTGATTLGGSLSVSGTGAATLGGLLNGATGSLNLFAGVLTLNAASVVNNFALGAGTLAGSGDLTVTGIFDASGQNATMAGTGTLVTNGSASIALVNTGSGAITLARPWVNNGTLLIGDDDQLRLDNGAVFTNAAGGSVVLASVAPAVITTVPAATSSVANAGTMTLSDAARHSIDATNFSNTGTVDAGIGHLAVSGSGSDTGTYTVPLGARLEFFGGSRTLAAGSDITGLGSLWLNTTVDVQGALSIAASGDGLLVAAGGADTVRFGAGTPGALVPITIESGTLNLDGPAVTLPTLALAGGTLGGSADVTVTGNFDASGQSATLAGTGTFTTAGSGLVRMDGVTGLLAVNKPWVNSGSLALEGDEQFVFNSGGSGGVLTNAVGGQILVTSVSATPIDFVGGGARLDNAGLLTLSSGGTSTVQLASFNNTGTVSVGFSTLRIVADGADTGAYGLVSGGSVDFAGGTRTLAAASNPGGTGSFAVSGADVTLSDGGAGTLTLLPLTVNSGSLTVNGSGSLSLPTVNVPGGTLRLDGPAGVSLSPILTIGSGVAGGATLFVNSGAPVTLNELFLNGAIIDGAHDMTVTTQLAVTGNESAILRGSGTLTTQGVTILDVSSGSGSINVGGGRSWVNDGTVNVLGDDAINLGVGAGSNTVLTNTASGVINLSSSFATPILLAGGTATINNAGTIGQTAPGTHEIQSSVLNNTGTVNVNAGTLLLRSDGTDTGRYDLGTGAVVEFGGGTRLLGASSFPSGVGSTVISGGNLSYDGGATVTLPPTTQTGGSFTVNSSGTLDVPALGNFLGGTLTLNGPAGITLPATLALGGVTLNLNSAAPVSLANLGLDGTTIGGTHDLTVTTALTLTGAQSGTVRGSGTLTTAGTTTIAVTPGTGSLALADTRNWVNSGTVDVGAGDAIGLGAVAGSNNTLSNTATGVINFNSDFANPVITSAGTTALVNAGTINQNDAGAHTFTLGSLNNTGTFNANAGSTDIGGTVTQSGTVRVAAGAVFGVPGGFTNAASGTLTGAGTVATGGGTLTNLGNIVPGTAGTAATLSVAGNLAMSSGTLTLDLGGTAAAASDRVAVSGNAALGGTVNAALIGGYTPVDGDFIPVVTSGGTATGTFALPTFPSGFTAGYNLAAGEAARLIFGAAGTRVFSNAAGDLNWATPANWGGSLPGSGDSALISSGFAVQHTAGAHTVAALTVNSADALTVSGGSLAVTGTTALGGALTVSGSGAVTLGGPLTGTGSVTTQGGTLTLNGASTMSSLLLTGGLLAGGGSLTVTDSFGRSGGASVGSGFAGVDITQANGTLQPLAWTAGSLAFRTLGTTASDTLLVNGALNASSGNVTLSSAQDIAFQSGTGSVSAAGNAVFSGAGQVNIGGPVLAQRVQGTSPNIVQITAGGSVSSTANSGDGIVLTGGVFRNAAGAGALSVAAGSRWLVYSADPAGDTVGGLVPTFRQYNAPGGTTPLGAGSGLLYAVAPTLTATLQGTVGKVYDGTTAATLTPANYGVAGALAGDTVTINSPAAGSYDTKAAGSAKTVNVTGIAATAVDAVDGYAVFGYTVNTTAAGAVGTVTPAQLPVFGMGPVDKVYDGTTNAPLAGTATVTPLAGDVVSVATIGASFSDKNVGINKLVAYTGVTLSGPDAGNYVVSLPIGALADITPLALPVTGLAAAGKVYDGTSLATLNGTAAVGALAGDNLLLAGSATATFSDKNVGTAKPVAVTGYSLAGTDAGNYTLLQPAALTADITPLALALTGLSAVDKVYDATTAAPLAGTATVTPLAGDTVTLAGTAVGSFGDKNVGANKLVGLGGLTLAGTDAGNYQLTPPVGLNASITPAALSLAVVSVASKVYDATTTASATATPGGVLAGDAVSVAVTASFSDPNAGTAKAVGYSATTAGADAANYTLAVASGSTVADITPATLTYVADPLTAPAGAALPTLTGSVTGFVGGDTLAGATTGTLAFTTSATGGSPAGSYAINGGGLSALNYLLVQAPGNATALTLSVAATSDPATTANQAALMLGLQSVQVRLAMSSPVEGRVLDVTPALVSGDGDGGLSFRAVNFSLMPRDEVQSLLAARAGYKKKVFAGGLSKLEIDPALADVPACRTEAELDTGNCLVTEALKKEIETIAARAAARPRKAERRKVRQAALPNIERKLALLIGINTYDDKRVPELGGAVPDARAVRDLLEGRLGYETTVVENARRETIVRAFNKLALEADANDSVVVYYAGHGEVVPVNGVDVGYWLPADVNPDEPKTWMSNSDIARMVAAIGARQMLLVSDSCYSGTLVGSEKVQLDQRTDAAELLKRKAAVVLSSGGNEPVADEGRNGHSVFAWHFMRAMEALDQWQVGSNVFEQVRAAVVKDFPQTPQYGASRTAGHQGNTDYLFERREFEAVVPVPVRSPVPLTAPKR